MKTVLSMGMAICLGITMLASCQRSTEVRAGAAGDYQPRPAPNSRVDVSKDPGPPVNQEIKGELLRVVFRDHALLMRVDNGMDQTIKWNDDTKVYGVPYLSPGKPSQAKQDARTAGEIKVLATAPGSDLAVEWVNDNGEKMATIINVTDLAHVKKKSRR